VRPLSSRGRSVRGIVITVGKVIEAEYDAGHNALHLIEPLEGVKDHERVQVQVISAPNPNPERPWMAFSGIMSKEQGEDFARAINELFPPWE